MGLSGLWKGGLSVLVGTNVFISGYVSRGITCNGSRAVRVTVKTRKSKVNVVFQLPSVVHCTVVTSE